jgi:hypothetical protein
MLLLALMVLKLYASKLRAALVFAAEDEERPGDNRGSFCILPSLLRCLFIL